MGDGGNEVYSGYVLDNYSVIYYNNDDTYEPDCNRRKTIFSCVSGIGSSEIGNLYFNNVVLPNDESNGFLIARTYNNPVLSVTLCGTLNTSTEGVYTCTLRNSSMMNQSMSVGIYLSGRSKSLHNDLIS